jgi:hypothetical protein
MDANRKLRNLSRVTAPRKRHVEELLTACASADVRTASQDKSI